MYIKNSFKEKGDTIYLVSSQEAIIFLTNNAVEGFITSFEPISDKGLFDSLINCCRENHLGFDITGDSDIEDKVFLHGKTKYLAIISVNEDQEDSFVDYMFNHGIETTLLGHVTKGELRMDDSSYGYIEKYI